MTKFYEILRYERELRGWSQNRVANAIETTRKNVSRWERGVYAPTPYFREKLCQLFGKNAEELGLLETLSPMGASPESLSVAHPQPRTVPSRELPAQNQNDQSNTYAYILKNVAQDQQAYMLWGDAYVHLLRKQEIEAHQLGLASAKLFAQQKHPAATVVQQWITQHFRESPTTSPPQEGPPLKRPHIPRNRWLMSFLLLLAVGPFSILLFSQNQVTAHSSVTASSARTSRESTQGISMGIVSPLSVVALKYYSENTTQTHWVTSGPVDKIYHAEGIAGYLSTVPLSGMLPLYGCYYSQGNAVLNDHFPSVDPHCGGAHLDSDLGRQYKAVLGYLYPPNSSVAGAFIPSYLCHAPTTAGFSYSLFLDTTCQGHMVEGWSYDGSIGYLYSAQTVYDCRSTQAKGIHVTISQTDVERDAHQVQEGVHSQTVGMRVATACAHLKIHPLVI